jgi:hypothetical protein
MIGLCHYSDEDWMIIRNLKDEEEKEKKKEQPNKQTK